MTILTNHNNSDWKKTLLSEHDSIKSAIENLNQSGMKIVLIVDSFNKLLGTITDGDIRRGILKGEDLKSNIKSIMELKPITVSGNISYNQILHVMSTNAIQQLPVIDKHGTIKGLHMLESFFNKPKKNNPLLIMAGGKGKRLRPYTNKIPKPMLEVMGKPILENIITNAKNNGFFNVIISINYLGRKIIDYFGDGKSFGVNISYLEEKDVLGTAGAMSLLRETLEFPLIVTNGDLITNINFSDLLDYHCKNKSDGTMVVKTHEIQNPFGVIKTKQNKIVEIIEKPVHQSYVNAGVYVFEPGCLKFLEYNKYCDMPDFFKTLIGKNKNTLVYPIHESWRDIGYPKDLEQANASY